MDARPGMTPRRLAAVLAFTLALLATGRPAAAQDTTVEVDGGRVTSTSDVRVSADGGEAVAAADGGSANTAALDARGRSATVDDASVEVGAGGDARADASGGEVAVEAVAMDPTTGDETLVLADIESGGNVGNDITAADTVASADGGASLSVAGADVVSTTAVTVSADGGVALATANGGDVNTVAVTAVATAGAATLTDLTIGVGNGVGDSATADASGGMATLGEIRAGGNTGGVIAIGSTTSLGGDATVVINGGTVSSTTVVAITANGGDAIAIANGGSGNAVHLTAEARGGGLTSVTDTLAGTGTGMATVAERRNTLLLFVDGGFTNGAVLPSGTIATRLTLDFAAATQPGPNRLLVPTSGRLLLTDRVTGDRLLLDTTGTLVITNEAQRVTYQATYTIARGTGRFAVATGSGTLRTIFTPTDNNTADAVLTVTGPLTLLVPGAPPSAEISGSTIVVGNGGDATAIADGGIVWAGSVVTGGNVGPAITIEAT